MAERVTCVKCGRSIVAYVPRGGDGSALLARRHRTSSNGPLCLGALGHLYDYETTTRPPTDDPDAATARGESTQEGQR